MQAGFEPGSFALETNGLALVHSVIWLYCCLFEGRINAFEVIEKMFGLFLIYDVVCKVHTVAGTERHLLRIGGEQHLAWIRFVEFPRRARLNVKRQCLRSLRALRMTHGIVERNMDTVLQFEEAIV